MPVSITQAVFPIPLPVPPIRVIPQGISCAGAVDSLESGLGFLPLPMILKIRSSSKRLTLGFFSSFSWRASGLPDCCSFHRILISMF